MFCSYKVVADAARVVARVDAQLVSTCQTLDLVM